MATETTPTAADGLPDVHPGCPGNARVDVHLIVFKTTPRAYLVATEARPYARFWLARSLMSLPRSTGRVFTGKLAGTVQINFDVMTFAMPVWLVRGRRKDLNA